MEKPASLFLFLYLILCPRLLSVSHEALPTNDAAVAIPMTFKIFFIKEIGPCLCITVRVGRRHSHNYFSLICTSDVFPASAF